MLPDRDYFKKYCQEKNIPFRERDVLREYLQTQVLKVLSLSDFNSAVSFLGGTSLRFLYGIERFSEDLDFDLLEKESFDIQVMEKEMVRGLERLGFDLDTKVKTTENIHIIYFKFKNVLQEFGFSVPRDQKLIIKFEIDFSPYQNIQHETKFIDSFGERLPVLINTLPTLFAQKVIALKLRPYQKGRDFYDLVWFLAQKNIEPNYAIFAEKGIEIKNKKELVAELREIIGSSDLEAAAKDIEPFVFQSGQAKWILNLPGLVRDYGNQAMVD